MEQQSFVMLTSFILLIYHAVSGFKKNQSRFHCVSELKQRLVDVWQSAAERY